MKLMKESYLKLKMKIIVNLMNLNLEANLEEIAEQWEEKI